MTQTLQRCAAGAGSLHRRATVTPATCGPSALFAAQVGDWTWETVAAACGTPVFNATDTSGAPVYLAFYYLHLRGGPGLHPGALRFGDALDVASRAFGFGSESVLTLHEVRRAGDAGGPPGSIDPRAFYERPHPGRMYVQSFNRWVRRGPRGGNLGLESASPVGFRHAHLATLPECYSPRAAYGRARARGTFLDPAAPGYAPGAGELELEYAVEPTRDLNGVGLVHFAAYFSIVDWALLRLWRALGREDRAFLERVETDRRICYLGNADPGSVLRIRLRWWRREAPPAREVFNAALDDPANGRPVAVCTVRTVTEPA